MKKYLALLLIALMAASVVSAAGVVTAKNDKQKPIPEFYKMPIGGKQSWSGNELNLQATEFVTDDTNPPQHTVSAVGNTATITVAAAADQYAWGLAIVGVQFKLQGVNANNWETVKARPVAVTFSYDYDISVDGYRQDQWPYWSAMTTVADSTSYHRVTLDGDQTGTVAQTYTTDNLGEPLTISSFVPNGDTGDYSGYIDVGVGITLPRGLDYQWAPQQAAGTAVVNSISIEYL